MKVQRGWHAILDAAALKPDRPVAVRAFGIDWVIWRDGNAGGKPVVMRDRCPHRAAKLSLGTVENGAIACPYHGIKFNGEGGCALVPELKRAAPGLWTPVLRSTEAHGFVWVWIGDVPATLPAVPWFDNLGAEFAMSQVEATWPTHFSRWIENELDITHLAFVHHNTIGRGIDPAYPSRFEFDDHGIEIYFDQQNPANREHQFAKLRYPNVWQLGISPSMFLVMAFVAVDDTTTRLYVRTYRRFGRWPGLSWLVDRLVNGFNRIVLAQDKRVVLSQQPRHSFEVSGEQLFREDAAIRQYRRLMADFVEVGEPLRVAPLRFQLRPVNEEVN